MAGNIESTQVKVKTIDPPRFDGKIREYPTFKKNYLRLMEKKYGQDPYALKQ